MQKVSECPNVSIKISGIGIPKSPWTIAANGGIVETLIEEAMRLAEEMESSGAPSVEVH